MNHRTAIAAAATTLALTATLTACESTSTSAHPGNAAINQGDRSTPAPTRHDKADCQIHYGTDGTGITLHDGHVTAAATLDCSATPGDVFISLTLAYSPLHAPMTQDREAAGAEYENARSAYTATAPCKPGTYALHVLYSATVDGTLLTHAEWGTPEAIADCAGN